MCRRDTVLQATMMYSNHPLAVWQHRNVQSLGTLTHTHPLPEMSHISPSVVQQVKPKTIVLMDCDITVK